MRTALFYNVLETGCDNHSEHDEHLTIREEVSQVPCHGDWQCLPWDWRVWQAAGQIRRRPLFSQGEQLKSESEPNWTSGVHSLPDHAVHLCGEGDHLHLQQGQGDPEQCLLWQQGRGDLANLVYRYTKKSESENYKKWWQESPWKYCIDNVYEEILIMKVHGQGGHLPKPNIHGADDGGRMGSRVWSQLAEQGGEHFDNHRSPFVMSKYHQLSFNSTSSLYINTIKGHHVNPDVWLSRRCFCPWAVGRQVVTKCSRRKVVIQLYVFSGLEGRQTWCSPW